MFKAVSVVGLALLSAQAMASDIRFTYVEAGLFGGTDSERIDFGDGDYLRSESDYTTFRVRGSVGFGEHFYLPAMIESAIHEYDDRGCFSGSCYHSESSVTEVTMTAGAGLRFAAGDMLMFYGDVSLLSDSYTVDDDGGYDDNDDEDDDWGSQLRVGLRLQPTDSVEFDLNFRRERVFDYVADWRNLSVQVNFTPSIGVGAEVRQESFDVSDLERNYYGAYFRFSFR
ncbi:outer membrane beta-barrel protein [Permianibacter sp. IMCC34836]|uniref:outer membrane beta-barrel protein n=1 Tax=Permianibacter fluminis TaxID=2738515 RepID=UPI0015544CE5|nr:outer membrane beta-barrel protein [Permianibacter fluminis]NQD36190.1 outer membrane beta-barrel protein [Permianibacter fluminis]